MLISRSVKVAFFVAALACAPAQAQDTRWTAPSGAWSIDYESQGWTFANPLPDRWRQVFVRVLVPRDPPPDGEVRMCGITEVPLNRTSDNPAEVRATAGQVNAAAVANMYTPRHQTVTGVTTGVIGDTSFADISTMSAQRPHLHRIFYMPVETRVFFVDIDCFWDASLDPSKAAEIPAVLGTITFNGNHP